MTAEKLHDALNLLPSDLLAATDQLRTAPRAKVIPWRHLIPAAACFVLLMGIGLLIRHEMLGHIVMKQAAPEAPAAMAPMPERLEIAPDAAAPQAPAMDEPMMETPAEEASGSNGSMEEELYVDHSHSFGEESDRTVNSHAYCGNMEAVVTIDATAYSLTGSDAVMLTDILAWLDYDPNTACRCMAEFTVDLETLKNIQVNLTEAFARCERGQASLTEEQVQTIRTIVEKLS